MTRVHGTVAVMLWLVLVSTNAAAQDLDPRAYARVPVGMTFTIEGLSSRPGQVPPAPAGEGEKSHMGLFGGVRRTNTRDFSVTKL